MRIPSRFMKKPWDRSHLSLQGIFPHLGVGAPLLVQQFGYDATLQHVEVLFLGPGQDEHHGRTPVSGAVSLGSRGRRGKEEKRMHLYGV